MTAQEFFKNDRFATNAGVELIEIKEGYSKARLVITETHLNAGNRTQGGALFYTGRPRLGSGSQFSRHTGFLTVFQYRLSCVAAVRATYYMPKPANGTSDVLPDIIRLTSPTRTVSW